MSVFRQTRDCKYARDPKLSSSLLTNSLQRAWTILIWSCLMTIMSQIFRGLWRKIDQVRLSDVKKYCFLHTCLLFWTTKRNDIQYSPDYIAAAEERAGRLSRNNEEKKESKMTKSTEIKTKKTNTQGAHLKRSQSTPRVNSILKSNETRMKDENRISNNKGIKNEKSVTILQNG